MQQPGDGDRTLRQMLVQLRQYEWTHDEKVRGLFAAVNINLWTAGHYIVNRGNNALILISH